MRGSLIRCATSVFFLFVVSSFLPSSVLASDSHRVRPGDTLGALAERYGCSVAAIRAANSLKGDLIQVGQELVIPEPGEAVEPVRASSTRRLKKRRVDTKKLARLMRARGFEPPEEFKALVVEFSFDKRRKRIVRERWFDYEGTSDDKRWNPASTVKLFAAIAATKWLRKRGFSPKATVTFEGEREEYEHKVGDLLKRALTPSDNIAYNHLVQITGFDYLNGRFFSKGLGFFDTALMNAYQQGLWVDQMGEPRSFRSTPGLRIEEGRRKKRFGPRRGRVKTKCHKSACTTLQELAECMRRLMLQEQLPAAQTYRLQKDDLRFIRKALVAHRSRGQDVVRALARSFRGKRTRLFHKPGFARNWMSDNVYIYAPGRKKAWVVTLAGYPGRECLTEAARIIGEILASGALR